MKTRLSHKFFCLLLTVVMACTLLPITALAAEPSGTILRAYLNTDRITVDMANVTFYESVALELYSGEIKLTTSTLNTNLVPANTYGELTGMIGLTATDEYWTYTAWTPKKDVVPDTVKLLVDGVEKGKAPLVVVFNGEETKPMPAEGWAALPGTVLPGSIERAVITHEGGLLKDAVSIDLKDITFADSVQVKLYSGDTPLTTATLKPGILAAGQNHLFVTCCIPTKGEDDAWSLTPWTPKDDVVPNKAVLVVDGHEEASKEFTLNPDEWADLPGTYSGSIERAGITHDNGVLKNAVSVDLKNVNFESSVQVQLYSGETLLTTATLQGFTPGSYHFLTCCIATETADANWALTPWTPKDDVVPNKAVLVVDGHEMDEKTFTLNADEWANLPGTAFPYTVTYLDGFSGTYVTYTNLKSGVVTPVPASPYRSGYIFLGWEPSVEPTVTGNAEYVAQWRYIGPQYPNPTPVQPVQPVQPGILPPQTGDMPLWYAIARFLGLVK